MDKYSSFINKSFFPIYHQNSVSIHSRNLQCAFVYLIAYTKNMYLFVLRILLWNHIQTKFFVDLCIISSIVTYGVPLQRKWDFFYGHKIYIWRLKAVIVYWNYLCQHFDRVKNILYYCTHHTVQIAYLKALIELIYRNDTYYCQTRSSMLSEHYGVIVVLIQAIQSKIAKCLQNVPD